MQTFLPHRSFLQSLAWLDYKRLGKQRVEAFQILCALGHNQALHERRLRNPNAKQVVGWTNHPATLMWRGYEESLVVYYNASIECWKDRGYKNTLPTLKINLAKLTTPEWLGWDKFHLSHQSNLLRKDFKHYSHYFNVRTDLPYVWPKGKY